MSAHRIAAAALTLASPGIVGTVGNQLYVARLDGNEMNTSTAAIDVSIPPSIHVGDFAGDGDHLAWSFDANGDGLRDVGLSSFPGDPVPGIQVHVLVRDGLGGVSQFEHEFEIACGVTAFSRQSQPAMASSTSPATPMKIALTRSLCILPVGLETGD